MKTIMIPVFLAVFFLTPLELPAQIRTDIPHVLPHTVFVGDRARLVVPLSAAFSEAAPFVLVGPAGLPQMPDLVIKRIELDRRGAFSRLFIDFVPFAAGLLYLPPLDFLFADEEEMTLPMLTVQVASILNPANMALSPPALPLAVPGTSLLVYGTGFLVLLLLSLGIAFSFIGPRYFRDFWQRLYHRYRLYTMTRFLRRLRQECSLDKNPNPGFYLTTLSAKLREFLSFYTGINCQSFTPMEFLSLPLDTTVIDPESLCSLFRAWDILRFSGQNMEMTDTFKAIDDVADLISHIDREEKLRRTDAKSSVSLADSAASLGTPKVSIGGNL